MKPVQACLLSVLGAAVSGAVAQESPLDSTAPPAVVVQVDVDASAAAVKHALNATPGLPDLGITVSTHANTVVLTGKVADEAQRAAVVAAAEKAAGGVRISANVEVRPQAERSPQEHLAAQQSAQLVRDVEAALKADSRTANLGITISSPEPQVVVLQGLVPTGENRTTVQNIASAVKGVSRIDNRLLVP